MKVVSLKYLIREGIRNLWTNRVMAFTSVGVLTTCLLIVGAAYLVTENVNSMVNYVEGQSEMSIFLKEFVEPQPEAPTEGETTPAEGETTPTEGETTPAEGDTTPAEGETTPTEGETTPTEGETTPTEGETTPSEGETTPTEGEYSTNLDRIAAVKAAITQHPNVKSCDHISKEQGLDNFKESLGENGYLLDGLEEMNYIPDTFAITLNDVSLTEQTKLELEKNAEVDLVVASTTVADTLTYIQRTVNTLGGAVILALGIISLVIVSNTIRATIFARRKEINIMKFVGAKNAFIRIPFVVEGFTLGLISAVISYLVIWGSYSYLIQAFTTDVSAWLNSAFENIIPFHEIALNLGLFFVITGTLLGSIGSVISIRNHAKV